MTIAQLLHHAREQLIRAGIESAALDARLLLQHVLDVSHEWVLAHDDAQISDAHCSEFDALIAQRTAHVPIAHLIGTRAFWKHAFMVTRDTLIPRPDSETMIEALLKLRPDTTQDYAILDLGTGTGCLLFSALHEYKNAHGTAIDISADALQVAKQNCQALSLQERVKFMEGAWCAPLNSSDKFHIVLSNPPYIPSTNIAGLSDEVKLHEPHLALDGGADGLKMYRAILECLPKHLHHASVVLFEVGDGQAHDVATLAETQGFTKIETYKDLGGIERVVAVSFP